MDIEKIRNIGLDKIVTQVYDFDSLTTDELMCKFAQKINIIIEHFNYLDKQCQNNNDNIKLKLEYLLGQGLEEQVAKRLIEKITDGTLGNLINESLLKDINDNVKNFKEEVNEQLEHKANKNDVARISSGTPLFVDSVEEMTDVTKNYVNLNDKYVYIYNGSSFEKTDVLYQAQGIEDKSIDNAKLMYVGLTRNRGIEFPLESISRNDTISEIVEQYKNLILDIKIYGAKKNKIYQLGWIGKNANIGNETYSGIELNEYDGDFGNRVTLIEYGVNENKVTVGTGIETRKYYIENMIIEISYDWSALGNNRQFVIRDTGIIINSSCYIPNLTNESMKNLKCYKNGDFLTVATKYNSDNDLFICFNKRGINNVYTFQEWRLAPNTNDYVTDDIIDVSSSSTRLVNTYSDFIGPYVVRAINNADGDNLEGKGGWTGGFHGSNGDQTGQASATMISYTIYVDNKEIENNKLYSCDEIKIVVVNNVQALNTRLIAGGGRNVIQETITYTIKPFGIVEIDVQIKALEDITIDNYMGLQAVCATVWDSEIFYDDDTSLNWITTNGSASASGNKTNSYCNSLVARKGSNYLKMWLDDKGLNKNKKHLTNTQPLAYYETTNKVYFKQIIEPLTLSTNDIVKWSGGYRFYSN